MPPVVVVSGRGVFARILNLLEIESLNSGHTGTWLPVRIAIAVIIVSMVWFALTAAVTAGLIALGVAWTAVVGAAAAIHMLASILIIRRYRRFGRNFLP